MPYKVEGEITILRGEIMSRGYIKEQSEREGVRRGKGRGRHGGSERLREGEDREVRGEKEEDERINKWRG